jgi:hypothetical protein
LVLSTPGAQPGGHAADRRSQDRQQGINAVQDQQCGERPAQGKAAVNRQVGKIENPEGDVNPQGHDSP